MITKSFDFKPDYFSVGDQILVAGMTLELSHAGCCYFLLNLDSGNGATVFYALGIADKEAFCAEYYGYRPTSGTDFPRTVLNDWPGIGRLAMALLVRSENMGFLLRKKVYNSSAQLKKGLLKYRDWVALGHYGLYSVNIDPKSKGFFLDDKSQDFSLMFNDLGCSAAEFFSRHYGYEALPGEFPRTKPGDYDALIRGLIALFKALEEAELIKV